MNKTFALNMQCLKAENHVYIGDRKYRKTDQYKQPGSNRPSCWITFLQVQIFHGRHIHVKSHMSIKASRDVIYMLK